MQRQHGLDMQLEMLHEAANMALCIKQTIEVCIRGSEQRRIAVYDTDGEGFGKSIASHDDLILCGSYVGQKLDEI